MILRRRGRDRRPRRGNVDGRLELLAVLLLLLLLLGLLVIGTCAVPATSAPVEHPLPPRATTTASVKNRRIFCPRLVKPSCLFLLPETSPIRTTNLYKLHTIEMQAIF